VLELPVAARADVEPACLVVGRVRGRGELPVALLRGEPALDVVLLHRRCTEVARGDVDDTVRDAEVADQLFLDREQVLVLAAGGVERGEHEHLDLVELMDTEHAARVLAGSSRFAAEVRRVADIAEWQQCLVDDLACVHGGQADLRGAGEKELVALDPVDVDLVGREEPRPVHRFLADEHRRQNDREAPLHEAVERVTVERDLELREVADAVGEARSGDLRRALHVDPPVRLREIEMVLCGEVEGGRLPDAPHLDRVVVREAVRRVHGGRVRDAGEQLPPACLRGAERLLERLELGLHALELLQLLGRRLALQLPPCSQILDARLHVEHCTVGREQLVERLGRALALECSPECVGILPCCAQVDHERESR
jgi:hypothetical protein